MELERIGVALRPRTAREAVDLGAAMLRAHAVPVWAAWFAFTLPFALVFIGLGYIVGVPWLGLPLLWWLLPLFDRLPLFVLSRAVFDRPPRWRETLRGQRKLPWAGTWASLTWRRVDSQRSLRLPLELLEGLTRQQRGPRWRVLRRNIGGSATMLTYGCFLLELVLFASVFLLAVLFVPHELISDPFGGLFGRDAHGSSLGLSVAVPMVGYLAMSVIEPWYVAAGFGLYLTRRTQLEAWDIDLAFRRMRQRLLDAGAAAAIVLALLVAFHPAHAADIHPPASSSDKTSPPVVQLDDVFRPVEPGSEQAFVDAAHRTFADPRFGREVKKLQWVRRKPAKPKPDEVTKGNIGFPDLVASGINLVLWLLLGAAIVVLGVFAWRYARAYARRQEEDRPATELRTAVSAVKSEEILPDDLAGSARALWRAGLRREALALLYRGCVAGMAAAADRVPDDATEAECLRRARAIENEELRRRAVTIVRTWQYAAYADRYPSDEEVESLLHGWPAQGMGRT
ncbi:MAG TPA: DUF4129 domain-containing protein [Dyella sp.]|uniref:DUF4129 domain-containing protein n=1 Tax=Dyella sp. TaxID=1869338 RepID=UPI002F95E0B2